MGSANIDHIFVKLPNFPSSPAVLIDTDPASEHHTTSTPLLSFSLLVVLAPERPLSHHKQA
jgi:hypothetical protein